MLFCHGSPRDDEEVVLVDTRLARWAEAFADVPPEVTTVCCGHTHMPFVRLVDRRLVVNPGSVGMPYGLPGGAWALLDGGSVTLHRTRVDVDAVVAARRGRVDVPRAAGVGGRVRPRGQQRRGRGARRSAPRDGRVPPR